MYVIMLPDTFSLGAFDFACAFNLKSHVYISVCLKLMWHPYMSETIGVVIATGIDIYAIYLSFFFLMFLCSFVMIFSTTFIFIYTNTWGTCVRPVLFISYCHKISLDVSVSILLNKKINAKNRIWDLCCFFFF